MYGMGREVQDTIVAKALAGAEWDEIARGLSPGPRPDGSPHWTVAQVQAAFEDIRLKKHGVRSHVWKYWKESPLERIEHYELWQERRVTKRYLFKKFDAVLKHSRVVQARQANSDYRSRQLPPDYQEQDRQRALEPCPDEYHCWLRAQHCVTGQHLTCFHADMPVDQPPEAGPSGSGLLSPNAEPPDSEPPSYDVALSEALTCAPSYTRYNR